MSNHSCFRSRVPLLPLYMIVACCLDFRHVGCLLLSSSVPLLTHVYPMDFTSIVLTVHTALPLTCLLFKKCCLLGMHLQTVSMASMLHAGSVPHLQPRRRLLQATLLHHCIWLLPIHHVPAARFTFLAIHQCAIQHLHPGLLYYCHRHVHTQWSALNWNKSEPR